MADPRTITTVWDLVGGGGKSWLSKKLAIERDGVVVVDYTSTRHVLWYLAEQQEKLHAIGRSAIIIIDVPRAAKITGELFTTLETVKNGVWQSPLKTSKPELASVVLQYQPHVIVFTNEQPTAKGWFENMSADRWHIYTICPSTDRLVEDRSADDALRVLTEKREQAQRDAINGIQNLPADPAEEAFDACFEEADGSADKFYVKKDILVKMQQDGDYSGTSDKVLGHYLAKRFKLSAIVKKGNDRKGHFYTGLRMKA